MAEDETERFGQAGIALQTHGRAGLVQAAFGQQSGQALHGQGEADIGGGLGLPGVQAGCVAFLVQGEVDAEGAGFDAHMGVGMGGEPFACPGGGGEQVVEGVDKDLIGQTVHDDGRSKGSGQGCPLRGDETDQETCWMPATSQPWLPLIGLVRCQISSNWVGAASAPSRSVPLKRTLTM